MFAILITFIIILLIAYSFRTTVKPSKYPPGPQWVPFLGCSGIVQKYSRMHGSQWKAFLELSKKYSTDVLGLKLGGERVVVMFGVNNVKQAFAEQEYEGRPDSFFLRLRCLGNRGGITINDGSLWRQQRNFTMKELHNVGFGKTRMDKEIQDSLNIDILGYINKNKDKPINVKNILPLSVLHVLWVFVAGERIEEKRLKYLVTLLNDRCKAFSMAGGLLNMFPWSRYIIPEYSGYTLIKKINQEISDIIGEAIEKHKCATFSGNDFMYAFLEEINNSKNSYTEEELKVICLDLLIAGSQTTSYTLEFAILALLRNKGLQEKIYNEIKTMIGDELPSWNHSDRLPYTSAFLLEVQRYYPVASLAGPRRVLKETMMDGYLIPKDTTVLMSLPDLHFSPEIWKEPALFNPDRFINEEGSLKIGDTPFYPFGHGRRRCPGDTLAKSFIFIVFVGILQKYKIECANGVLPSDEMIIGLLSAPKPYSVVFVPRN